MAPILTVEPDRALINHEALLVGQPLVALGQRVVERKAELLRRVGDRVAQDDVEVDHNSAGPVGAVRWRRAD